MTRYLKLIWFAEEFLDWTKYHAAVGINAQKTLCGVYRSTRAILPSEKLSPDDDKWQHVQHWKCSKCRAALRKRYGSEDIERVKVE